MSTTLPEGGAQTPQVPMKPHRATTVLVLGILGLVCCVICGIIAWIMGNKDLQEMDAGIMDPTGRGTTNAGRICGIVSVCLAVAGTIIWIIMFALGAFVPGMIPQ